MTDLPAYSDVEYGGVRMRTFRCDTHRANLTTEGCAKRWKAAQDARGIAYVQKTTAREHFDAAVERVLATQHGRNQPGHRKVLGIARNRREVAQSHCDGLEACASCPLGAMHAGCEAIRVSAHYNAPICPRCGTGGLRMIGNRVCVSCYNREREVARGRNARGNVPERLKPPQAYQIRLVVDNDPRPLVAEAAHLGEVVGQVLRTTRGELAFAPRRNHAALQLRLFA